MNGNKVFKFPPSQEFMHSPQFRRVPGGVELVYDQEQENGGYQDQALLFRGVLAFRYTSMALLEPWMTGAYDVLISQDDSSWLQSIRQNYRGGKPFAHNHYMVYFDDHGFYEIVAAEVVGAS